MQLEPRRRRGFAHEAEALVRPGSPHADDGLTGVGDDGHRAEVHDIHDRRDDLTALARRRLGRLRRVLRGQVHRPHVGHPFARIRHPARDEGAVLCEVEVAAQLRVRLLRRPAEQLAVERPRLVRVGAHHVDPAGGSDGGGFTLGHGGLLEAVSSDCTSVDRGRIRNSSVKHCLPRPTWRETRTGRAGAG